MRKVKHSQAILELAILASFVLMGFGMILTYVNKLNSDQWVLMSAFRNALAKAHNTNKEVSYTVFDDRYQASIQSPIIGERVTSSAGATVYWAIYDVTEGSGKSESESSEYIKINGGAIPRLFEYKLTKGGGGVTPIYFTFEKSKVTIENSANTTVTNRSAGLGEVMIYKVGKQVFVQGRAHGGSRTFTVKD